MQNLWLTFFKIPHKWDDIWPEIAEPLDQLCGVGLVELDIGEKIAQYCRAGIPGKKEHQLCLAQMQRGQCGSVLKELSLNNIFFFSSFLK